MVFPVQEVLKDLQDPKEREVTVDRLVLKVLQVQRVSVDLKALLVL